MSSSELNNSNEEIISIGIIGCSNNSCSNEWIYKQKEECLYDPFKFIRNFQSLNEKQNDKSKEKSAPSREFADVICPACGQAGHHIAYHGCDLYAIKQNLDKFQIDKYRNTTEQKVMDIFKNYQKNKNLKIMMTIRIT